MPSRKGAASLSHSDLVAARRLDEVVRVRLLRGADDLALQPVGGPVGVGGERRAKGDVVAQGAAEEVRLLWDDGELPRGGED